MEEKFNYFVMIGHLVSIYKKGQIRDVDLFNSIIRLVYFSDVDKNLLKTVIDWLNFHEKNNTAPEVQYDSQNVKKAVGEDYFEGLTRLFSEEIYGKQKGVIPQL